jgi:hypothetical protein
MWASSSTFSLWYTGAPWFYGQSTSLLSWGCKFKFTAWSDEDWRKDIVQGLLGVFLNITFYSCHNILIFYLLVFLHSQLQYARWCDERGRGELRKAGKQWSLPSNIFPRALNFASRDHWCRSGPTGSAELDPYSESTSGLRKLKRWL